jgi:hypothetical protein
MLSRRGFVAGALGLGLSAAAASGAGLLGGCSSGQGQGGTLASTTVSDEEIVTLSVAEDQVLEAADFDEAPFEDYLKFKASFELPLGSLMSQIDQQSVLVLLPTEQDSNRRSIALMDLGNGVTTTILPNPVGTGRNVVIYDARASRNRLIWVEVDLGKGDWNCYVAPLSGTVIGNVLLVEQGDALYEPPMLAVADNKVYWTVMPLASGAANLEDSKLKAIDFNKSSFSSLPRAYVVLTSHGRMITNPLVNQGSITLVPRVDTDNIYYQLTALSCDDDRPLVYQVLPQSLRVCEALYTSGAFAFSIEDNYSYAGGLSRFGSYLQLSGGEYLHVARPPMNPVVRFNDCLIVKSTYNIVGIDPIARRSFVIDTPPRSSGFGEALVGWGDQGQVVTCSIRIAEGGGSAEKTILRVFG